MSVTLDRHVDLSPDTDLSLTVAAIARDTALWADQVRMLPWRWWRQLHCDDNIDIWLITWPRNTWTDLHDHGPSAAAFTVARGRLAEVRPDPLARRRPVTTHVSTGEVRNVAVGDVHDVWNPFPTPAVSIHAYSPPLSEMTYYAAVGERLTPLRTTETRTPEPVR